MNKQELVDAVGERLGDRKAAAVAVEAVLGTVTSALADGERVALFGFGVFERVERGARTARNPSTGGTVEVPATSVARFRPGQALKDAVNGRSAGERSASRTSSDGAPATRPTKAAPAGKAAAAEDTKSAGKGRTTAKDTGKGTAKDTGKGKSTGKSTGKAKGGKTKSKAKGKGD